MMGKIILFPKTELERPDQVFSTFAGQSKQYSAELLIFTGTNCSEAVEKLRQK